MKEQLTTDIAAVESCKERLAGAAAGATTKKIARRGSRISLLAKWLSRAKSHFDKTQLNFCDSFVKVMWPNEAVPAKALYCKTVTELTAFFECQEVLLVMQCADEITSTSCAKATLLLTKALLTACSTRTARTPNRAPTTQSASLPHRQCRRCAPSPALRAFVSGKCWPGPPYLIHIHPRPP